MSGFCRSCTRARTLSAKMDGLVCVSGPTEGLFAAQYFAAQYIVGLL